MLTICCWKWGDRFSAVHVNVLAAAFARHLHLDHEVVCITDDAAGVDPSVRVIPSPAIFRETPRCRRRMVGFSKAFGAEFSERVLYCDLDVVITDDLTPIVDRPEPIVGWKVGHAGVYSGSFLLADNGALDGAWQKFSDDPDGWPRQIQPRGIASDQAMVNDWLKTQPPIAEWTEADGFVTYYGKGYEKHEHLGVGPSHPNLPLGARIVVLGSDDLDVLSQSRYDWVKTHWTALVPVAMKAAS